MDLVLSEASAHHSIINGGEFNYSDLGPLMTNWGVNFKRSQFVGDKYLSGVTRMGPSAPPMRMIGIITCNENCKANPNETITTNFNNSLFFFPTFLEINKKEGLIYNPILQTTDKGNSYTASGTQINNPKGIWNRFQEGSRPIPLAYKIQGKFSSSFKNGIYIEDDNKQKIELKSKTLESEETAMIIFSDVDFIFDKYAFKRNLFGHSVAHDGPNLLLNSLELLSGDIELMTVRSKGKIL